MQSSTLATAILPNWLGNLSGWVQGPWDPGPPIQGQVAPKRPQRLSQSQAPPWTGPTPDLPWCHTLAQPSALLKTQEALQNLGFVFLFFCFSKSLNTSSVPLPARPELRRQRRAQGDLLPHPLWLVAWGGGGGGSQAWGKRSHPQSLEYRAGSKQVVPRAKGREAGLGDR